MTPPRTVVVALDLSPGSEAALVRAATLAARAGAALHAVHADVAGPPAPADGLAAFVEGALGPGAVPLHRLAVAGGPTVPAAILRYARRAGADLLVVGTHGRSGLDRVLVGSVAAACVAAAPCPVLTVPGGAEAHEPSPEAPVLVAVDFGALGRAALDAGRALADLHGADLEAVHVVREVGPYAGLSPSALSLAGTDPERDAAVRQRLARFAGGVPVEAVHVALGAPSRQVAAVAAARRAGAVVMGTHGRTGLAHALLGSTAEATLRRASCAVLTVRPVAGPPRRRRVRHAAAAS